MLFKIKFFLCVILSNLSLSVADGSLSFNQPKLCPNASWNANGVVFSTADSSPYGLFVHSSDAVYVTEQATNQVQIWSNQGGTPRKTIGNSLNNPGAIFVTMNGDIYVDSGGDLQVQKWTTNAANGVIVMNVTGQCLGLFIDTNNTLYCSASDSHQVLVQSLINNIYQSGTVVAGNDTCGDTSTQLCLPNGIFVDLNFNLYVADYWNDRIQKFKRGEQTGQTVAGIDVLGSAYLSGPIAVVLDADNYLFITDMENNRIIRVGPNRVQCIVGCSQISGFLTSQLSGPRGLGFDSYGNLFVADMDNNRILKFTLATNSCGQDVSSTTVTLITVSTSANRQIHNGFDQTNRIAILRLNLWLVIIICDVLF